MPRTYASPSTKELGVSTLRLLFNAFINDFLWLQPFPPYTAAIANQMAVVISTITLHANTLGYID